VCSLADGSADLVTVAQAWHWFDHERAVAEFRRVLRPDGVVALWTYGISRVDAAVDAVFDRLYDGPLGPYWLPERRHVENGYRELPFPFAEIAAPAFAMTQRWTLPQYLAYLRSWSASQRHLQATGIDAVSAMEAEFAAAWGAPETVRVVRWPLGMRVGRTGPL
jgi:SAM-dependent methyltransferase